MRWLCRRTGSLRPGWGWQWSVTSGPSHRPPPSQWACRETAPCRWRSLMPSASGAGQGEIHCSDQGNIAPGVGVWFRWLSEEASGARAAWLTEGADANRAFGPGLSTWLSPPGPLRKRAPHLVSFPKAPGATVCVYPPEGDQEHESPNLGLTWHVGQGWPKSGCAGSLVGVGLAGGRGGETPQIGFSASGAACLTSPRLSSPSCDSMRSSSGCTVPTREVYAGLPVRGSQPGRTGGMPVSP